MAFGAAFFAVEAVFEAAVFCAAFFCEVADVFEDVSVFFAVTVVFAGVRLVSTAEEVWGVATGAGVETVFEPEATF